MKRTMLLALIVLAACSTVESRREKSPTAEFTTTTPLQTFQGCFAERTAKLEVNYLPRTNGGSFSATGGPQRYVFWVVDVDDLGSTRHVTVYAANHRLAEKSAVPAIRACI